MFRSDFMEWFEELKLPPYHLERKAGQYELTFEGSWPEVMLWEVPALSVLMELRGRAVLNKMAKFELEVLYARAMTKLWEKIENLRNIEDLKIADFGTSKKADTVNVEGETLTGTEGFMAPEIKDRFDQGVKKGSAPLKIQPCDVWSLCASIWCVARLFYPKANCEFINGDHVKLPLPKGFTQIFFDILNKS